MITVVAIFNSWLLKVILHSAVVETSVIDWKREAVSVFDSNVNKIFLGTDGAASLWVGQMLPLRVEGSIPYSAPLTLSTLHESGPWSLDEALWSVVTYFSLMVATL